MNDQQLDRYSRHLLLPQLDYDGQTRILNSHVLILGLGGLGSSAALYMASSGVGRITLVDPDQLENSNLQRQIIHNESRIGQNKALSAKHSIELLNSSTQVMAVDDELTESALAKLVAEADVVLDCTDNGPSRRLHNRLCIQYKTPLVSAAAIRFEGQMMVIDPRNEDAPCYQCVYPETDQAEMSCSESGIFAPVVGLMGVYQALEGLKLLADIGDNLSGKLMSFDGLSGQWRNFNVQKNPKCTVCGSHTS